MRSLKNSCTRPVSSERHGCCPAWCRRAAPRSHPVRRSCPRRRSGHGSDTAPPAVPAACSGVLCQAPVCLRNGGCLVGIRLGITSRQHQQSIRVFPAHLSHGVAQAAVPGCGDGAGVEQENVRLFRAERPPYSRRFAAETASRRSHRCSPCIRMYKNNSSSLCDTSSSPEKRRNFRKNDRVSAESLRRFHWIFMKINVTVKKTGVFPLLLYYIDEIVAIVLTRKFFRGRL